MVKYIRVSGIIKIGKEEVIKLTGLRGGERLFKIDLKEIKKKIEAHPYVEEVFWAHRFPSAFEIVVKEREGLVIFIIDNKGYLIDKKGVIIGRNFTTKLSLLFSR